MTQQPVINCSVCNDAIIGNIFHCVVPHRDSMILVPKCQNCFEGKTDLHELFKRDVRAWSGMGDKLCFGEDDENMAQLEHSKSYCAIIGKDFATTEKSMKALRKARERGIPLFAVIASGTHLSPELENTPWKSRHYFKDKASLEFAMKLVSREIDYWLKKK